MLEEQLRARGVHDERVLAAMARLPRERFVEAWYPEDAYADHAQPIGHGQTISQPFVVAFMSAALSLAGHERVLEIGTGSGYQTAVLCALAARVYTVEIVPRLARRAARVLAALGCANAVLRTGDGAAGWPEEAPFDAVLVTAAPARLPRALLEQLAPGGRLVAPVGTEHQRLVRALRRRDGTFAQERLLDVRFVPLVGGSGA